MQLPPGWVTDGRSNQGPCRYSTDTARSLGGRHSERRSRGERDTEPSNSGNRARRSDGNGASPGPRRTGLHPRHRRPRRQSARSQPGRERVAAPPPVPGPEPPVPCGCCTPQKATAGRLPPQRTTSLFASYFPPPGKRIDFDTGPVGLGERHRRIRRPSFSIGRLSGKSCTILSGSTTVAMCFIPQPCTFDTIGIN